MICVSGGARSALYNITPLAFWRLRFLHRAPPPTISYSLLSTLVHSAERALYCIFSAAIRSACRPFEICDRTYKRTPVSRMVPMTLCGFCKLPSYACTNLCNRTFANKFYPNNNSEDSFHYLVGSSIENSIKLSLNKSTDSLSRLSDMRCCSIRTLHAQGRFIIVASLFCFWLARLS